jgi:hypothetical protein
MINQRYLHKIMPYSGRSYTALKLRFEILASVFNKRYFPYLFYNNRVFTDWFIETDVRGVNGYLWEK